MTNEVSGQQEDNDNEDEKLLTDYDKYEIRNKSVYLLSLYQVVEDVGAYLGIDATCMRRHGRAGEKTRKNI